MLNRYGRTLSLSATAVVAASTNAMAAPDYQLTDTDISSITNINNWNYADYYFQGDGVRDTAGTSAITVRANNSDASLTNIRIGSFNTGETAQFYLYDTTDGDRTLLSSFEFVSDTDGFKEFDLDSPIQLEEGHQYTAFVSRTLDDTTPLLNLGRNFYEDNLFVGDLDYLGSGYEEGFDELVDPRIQYPTDSIHNYLVGLIDFGTTPNSELPNNIAAPTPAALPIGLMSLGLITLRRKR